MRSDPPARARTRRLRRTVRWLPTFAVILKRPRQRLTVAAGHKALKSTSPFRETLRRPPCISAEIRGGPREMTRYAAPRSAGKLEPSPYSRSDRPSLLASPAEARPKKVGNLEESQPSNGHSDAELRTEKRCRPRRRAFTVRDDLRPNTTSKPTARSSRPSPFRSPTAETTPGGSRTPSRAGGGRRSVGSAVAARRPPRQRRRMRSRGRAPGRS